jgi:hypothetical protein
MKDRLIGWTHRVAVLSMALFLLTCIYQIFADDVITLNSGEIIIGRVVNNTDTNISILVGNHNNAHFFTKVIAKSDIKKDDIGQDLTPGYTSIIPDGYLYATHNAPNLPNGWQGLGWSNFVNALRYVDLSTNGYCVVILPNANKYIGEMKDGKPNGRGTEFWQGGLKCIGEFKDGMFNGRGMEIWIDGHTLEGEFKDGMPVNGGTETYSDGRKYVGEYQGHQSNGMGTMTYFDGRRYVGQFKVGRIDGKGKMTYPNGKVEDGLWKDDKFVEASTSP